MSRFVQAAAFLAAATVGAALLIAVPFASAPMARAQAVLTPPMPGNPPPVANPAAPPAEPDAVPGANPADSNAAPAQTVPDPTAPDASLAPIAPEFIPGRLAVLRGLDKITGRTVDFRAPIGQKVRFKSLIVLARACEKAPPESLPEVAVFAEIEEAQRAIAATKTPQHAGTKPEFRVARVFSGWLFASSPGLSALEHPVYDVWAIDCRT